MTELQQLQRDQRHQEEYFREWVGWLTVGMLVVLAVGLAWKEIRRRA